MGNADTKLQFRKAVVQLTTKTKTIDATDDIFWEQFWCEHVTSIQDVFTLIPAAEIRALREESPTNLATLCYKAVEKLVHAADTGCSTQQEQQSVLNCVRILMRIIPYIFEDPDWRGFFWSSLPAGGEDGECGESVPLAHSLLHALCDLLFCPDFTVPPSKKSGPDKHEDLQSIDSCEYIWEAGVGFAHAPPHVPYHDQCRTEILKLILTCFSHTIYMPPSGEGSGAPNRWISAFTSAGNRHALPLFTSLLNLVCGYDPVGLGVPYNHLLFSDSREPLVDVALQILITTLDHDVSNAAWPEAEEASVPDNLFINYLSRIHREEDFSFVLQGFTRLLNNPLQQTYLPHSTKKVGFHQELLVFFWKFCDFNKKFLFYVLKSSDVLDILVPILYHLNDARADQYMAYGKERATLPLHLISGPAPLTLHSENIASTRTFSPWMPMCGDTGKSPSPALSVISSCADYSERARVGLMHIGVFILLLLSGERNFGVRLNKPYTAAVPIDIPVFTGTHADLLIIIFHKIITTGHQRLQPLFDCLLTILVNVSPYVKTLSMVASTKLLHLLEAFSTPWFLFSAPHHHHLVFFLLETFNNIIQYQFDGNSNLVYTIIRKRAVFHALANLPTDYGTINKSLHRRGKRALIRQPSSESSRDSRMMEGSHPAQPAMPGTKTATLAALPGLEKMTEKESAHPTVQQLSELTSVSANGDLVSATTPTSPNAPSQLPVVAPGNLEDSPTHSILPATSVQPPAQDQQVPIDSPQTPEKNVEEERRGDGWEEPEGAEGEPEETNGGTSKSVSSPTGRSSPSPSVKSVQSDSSGPSMMSSVGRCDSVASNATLPNLSQHWTPSSSWVLSWKTKLPLQTIMRLLQVLVPQVEKICIDKGLTDESEILRFLQHGTLVGLLPVPHPILIRKYQANAGTTMWFRTYMWGIIYLRNVDPPIWYDTDVKLFEIQRV
ncbi:protein HID1 isoform X2 [Oratosquilla oratoria]|uniref:protein HID1 isoform X2 n=1 Tax=Oratosquilla oratoria TaxID=337810 RepID=UPI003F76DB07